MKLAVIAFGKLKTPGLRDAADYYKKILSPWNALEEIELKPVIVTDKAEAMRRQVQDKESAMLLEKLEPRYTSGRGAFFLLSEEGKAWSTEAWAKAIRGWEDSGLTDLALCLGSSLGFSDALRKKARGCLSLGPQTLPHELARVVLMEQLYRSYSVLKNHPYHNSGA